MKANLLIYSLSLLFRLVQAGKREIVSFDPTQSWILTENFTTLLKLSFPSAKCCNVHLNDKSPGVDKLMTQFKNTFPNDYVLNQKTYECQGYFLVGSTDIDLIEVINHVPVSIATTEILIIVNDIIESNSSIFDGSLYGNADVNMVSLSGKWSLSENYLTPRIFNKVARYDEMLHQYEKFNFRGRRLQACSFYWPPFSYLNRTVNTTINGVQAEVYLADDELERDGIEMQLFLLMAEKFNFTWTIRNREGAEKFGSPINGTHWKGGIMPMLLDHKVDIAFASIWITVDHNAFVNLTVPWYQVYIHFLVPRPQPITSFWALVRPFPMDIWILVFCALLAYSFYTYARAWIDEKFPRRFRNFFTAIIDLLGYFLGTTKPDSIPRGKFHVLLWQTAGWLIISAYCSSLAARLASSDYEERIDTIKQFIDANITWGRKGPQSTFNDYFDLLNPYTAQMPSRYRPVENDEVTRKYISNGKYAILGRIVDTTFFPEDYVPNEALKNYRIMKERLGSFYAAFAVQPWLLKPINKMILSLKESGIVLYHMRDVINRRDSFTLRETGTEYDRNDEPARILGLIPLGVGFLVFIIGILTSSFVFYLELQYAGAPTSRREVSHRINKKRKPIGVTSKKNRRVFEFR